jgi:hypothetical protein
MVVSSLSRSWCTSTAATAHAASFAGRVMAACFSDLLLRLSSTRTVPVWIGGFAQCGTPGTPPTRGRRWQRGGMRLTGITYWQTVANGSRVLHGQDV